ncbi:TetM/TetW/TetO/TetS family tetracycline resistance ribosomal protection protein [Clostridiaceae bacterium NSJ-31]|uniref:TetM/TetW/TetO/TetS family tetracycline resistance ribosomal protection protein n=1 Tax=Ligaoa zhengdingensis TaxID=2763658 RepID=A0A926E1C5_9FIRM|nr:TetM/TetW/TetO/TetS family tetracycline resistance ribosomal protection protein [Ligaoa zhengdingensis]MBC8547274.1 TetM/TetW/TetO/TetS family tetracycline resistance ribosomal protection protein [Ligaoa zhengdingensis]
MNKVLGILAHVDAGKTTLSEQLLYRTQSIRTLGRVDHRDAFLDHNRLERERGITIFSDQAHFSYGGNCYFLVDTPGHVDFSAEMERVLGVLDFAIVVVSCVEGVQGHTETIWQLLERYRVPALFFLNKTDREGADPERVQRELQAKFSPAVCDFTASFTEPLVERLAELDDNLLERYLGAGFDEAAWLEAARELVHERRLFPCFCGAALSGDGIDAFLQWLDKLTHTGYNADAPFAARVYQVRHDARGDRLALLKVTSGTLRVKDAVGAEKVNEIRRYNGTKYVPAQQSCAGELCAVTGLASVRPGDALGAEPPWSSPCPTPPLMARVEFDRALPARTVLGQFRLLEEEDPALAVEWQEELQEIRVRIMGEIQLEVLRELVCDRFGTEVSFGSPEILYQETIAAPVIGYGHYEPLRHYAEVHLRLEPGARGRGITFRSECPTDLLALNWQRLIETHVFERVHRGVLTGSPLTDVAVVLLTGRAHDKHTEGGDFRQAVYRAIRQGLEQEKSLLLEPYYAFVISVDTTLVGRVLADLQRMSGRFEPPELECGRAVIRGRAPVATMMSYGRDLAAFSRGRGSISLRVDGYEPCHNPDDVIARRAYDRTRDLANPSDSVFCSHGAGFPVPWYEVERYLHCK